MRLFARAYFMTKKFQLPNGLKTSRHAVLPINISLSEREASQFLIFVTKPRIRKCSTSAVPVIIWQPCPARRKRCRFDHDLRKSKSARSSRRLPSDKPQIILRVRCYSIAHPDIYLARVSIQCLIQQVSPY